ncbi:hypothetical protein [Streptomyces sp. NPDC059928]|uniref:hypothetical protein n=1 Tax=unclassified Streptomyces TaxID=2593676 RepID=UPI003653C56B
MLDRIARATKPVPAGVATASQKAVGPRLAAAVAGKLEPARAAESLLPLVMLLGEEDRRAVALLPALTDPAVLAGVVPAVVATALWAEFLPLVEPLPERSRTVVAEAASSLTDEELDALAREVDKRNLWEPVLPLVELMTDPAKERIFALSAFQDRGDGA